MGKAAILCSLTLDIKGDYIGRNGIVNPEQLPPW